jgi:hypothetical protein
MQGLLLTETGGIWAQGIEAVVPSAPPQPPGVTQFAPVDAVSCPSVGNCSAVGTYGDPSHIWHGLLLSETDGSWSPGVEAALPANAHSTENTLSTSLGDVSCASVGNCSAVGGYHDSSGNQMGLLLTETGGTWAAGVEAKLPANAATTNQRVGLASVSCASPGNCSAVGTYLDAFGIQQGLLLTETDGSWAPGVEAVLPTALTAGYIFINSVSCPSAGNCTAVGEYWRGYGYLTQGLLLTETAGSWAPGVGVALPANAEAADSLNSVSCPSDGNCAAVGSYYDSKGLQGLLLSETDGSWSPGVEAQPADVRASTGSLAGLQSVSCGSAGNCTAVGGYSDGFGATVPILVTETAGSWATGVAASLPANAQAPQGYSQLDSVSCPGSGPCGAGGFYCPTGGTCGYYGTKYPEFGTGQEGLLTGDSPPLVTLDIAKNGTGSGTVSDAQTGIDCGSVCSVSFAAGTTLTLKATPSAGSTLAVPEFWGHACSYRLCQMRTIVSDQTVTVTFNLQKCNVPRLRGKTLKAAEHAIRNRNCTMGKITQATSQTIKQGHVISQKPRPGSRLRHGARVNLVVSKGRH